MSESPKSSKEANLARIRDNQRRSRARRKQYVQELEAKYRDCESKGVQASAQMQTAARRVADENKQLREENIKLRAILGQLGWTESDIQRHFAANPGGARARSNSPGFDKSNVTSAETLEGLLSVQDTPATTVTDVSSISSPSPPQPSIHIAAPTPSPISKSPQVPRHQLQSLVVPSFAPAPALLSPSIQSLPSSSVSTPSAWEQADDYILSSPESSTSTQPLTPQAIYTSASYGYLNLESTSWPQSFETSYQTPTTSQPPLPPMSVPADMSTGPNIPYAQVTPTQASSAGLHLTTMPVVTKPMEGNALAEAFSYCAVPSQGNKYLDLDTDVGGLEENQRWQ